DPFTTPSRPLHDPFTPPPARSISRPTSSGTNEAITKQRFGASAPGARPQKTGARSSMGNQRAAAIALNGQRVGELNESFWTAAWRWITWLESGLRSQVPGHKAPARSTESE